MRLQPKEMQTILQVARRIYGETVKVYLFGSRLDDIKRGGDIDLLSKTDVLFGIYDKAKAIYKT